MKIATSTESLSTYAREYIYYTKGITKLPKQGVNYIPLVDYSTGI